MATGIAIMGFGGGAMLGKPMIEGFLRYYHKLPEYLGNVDSLKLVTDETGRRLTEISEKVYISYLYSLCSHWRIQRLRELIGLRRFSGFCSEKWKDRGRETGSEATRRGIY